jgi:hypothetical protein
VINQQTSTHSPHDVGHRSGQRQLDLTSACLGLPPLTSKLYHMIGTLRHTVIIVGAAVASLTEHPTTLNLSLDIARATSS